MRGAEHGDENAYKILIGKSEEKRLEDSGLYGR
jgi:hypothetical protein